MTIYLNEIILITNYNSILQHSNILSNQDHSLFPTVKISFFLHSTFSIVELDFGALLLFEALHCSSLALSTFFPVILIKAASVPTLLVMSSEPKYQVKVAAGTAFLFTTHLISRVTPSIIVSGLSLGIMDTLWTSTVSQGKKIMF